MESVFPTVNWTRTVPLAPRNTVRFVGAVRAGGAGSAIEIVWPVTSAFETLNDVTDGLLMGDDAIKAPVSGLLVSIHAAS